MERLQLRATMNRNKFYVTTPIYYVNSKPHLGTLYTTLLADIFARWNKIMGKNVFFLTGTDEHGQKLQEAADKAGMQPKQFVDSVVPEFKKTWADYEIEYSKFIRTTDEEHQKCCKIFYRKVARAGRYLQIILHRYVLRAVRNICNN